MRYLIVRLLPWNTERLHLIARLGRLNCERVHLIGRNLALEVELLYLGVQLLIGCLNRLINQGV